MGQMCSIVIYDEGGCPRGGGNVLHSTWSVQ